MYRKRNGSIGFSFTSFVQSAVPSMGMSTPPNHWVPEVGRDMLYAHQISATHPGAPFALDERSLFVGGICDHEGTSNNVFHKLGRVGILDEQGCVCTNRIEGKKFPHQVTVLSMPRQRDLLGLLFWWEEECSRLRKLIDEERELGRQIKDLANTENAIETREDSLLGAEDRAQLLDHLRFEREKLKMRIRQKPSQRRPDIESGTDELFMHANMAQGRDAQSPSVSVPQQQRDSSVLDERPPAYFRV